MTPFVETEYEPGAPGFLQKDQLFVNDTYQVALRKQGDGPLGPLISLSIRRLDRECIFDWRDIQQIKNMLCGPEAEAVQLFPAESRLVDTSNQYYIFCFPKFTFPFGFKERLVTEETFGKSKQRHWPEDIKPKDLVGKEDFQKKLNEHGAGDMK